MRDFLTKCFDRCALVVISLVALTLPLPTFAQDAQWQPYTSSDFQFTVQEPGPVTVGKTAEGSGTTFSTTTNNLQFLIVARKLSPSELVSSWFVSDTGLWEAFLKGYGSQPTTAEDKTGKGWKGKIFTRDIAGKPKQSGLFGMSNNRDITYCAIVGGPGLSDDANTFLDSFASTEESGADIWTMVLGVIMILIGLGVTVGAVVLFLRAKKK
jgi:hypothetical protein